MFIYKITNLINGKVYIGQTIRPIEQRFKRHINDAINKNIDTHFARAILKYGKENFKIEKIDEGINHDDLNKKEQMWIKHYDSIKNGYNETDAIYKCGGNTYKSKTKDEMSLISEKLRKSKIGDKNPNSRGIKVKNIKTNEEFFFKTVKECQDFFHEKHHRFITTRVTGAVKTLYKGVWNISYSDQEYFTLKEKVTQNRCTIFVTDIETNETREFSSIRNMCETLKIPRSGIRNGVNTIVKKFNIVFK